jgi:hypothetical protein
MPKRPDSARVRAAVAAGDPPASAAYPDDDGWHAEQERWLAKWSPRVLPMGPLRRQQWKNRVKEHARLVAAAECASSSPPKPKRKRARKPPAPTVHEPVLAGPPQRKRPLPLSQPAYELAMGRYSLANEARRKLPRRTKAEDAERKRNARAAPSSRAIQNVVVEVGRKQAPHLNPANVRRDRERERSQQRRDASKVSRTCRVWKPGQMASLCVPVCKRATDVLHQTRQMTVTRKVGKCYMYTDDDVGSF